MVERNPWKMIKLKLYFVYNVLKITPFYILSYGYILVDNITVNDRIIQNYIFNLKDLNINF